MSESENKGADAPTIGKNQGGRPSKAEIDSRERALAEREAEIQRRERELEASARAAREASAGESAKPFDDLPPRVSADEVRERRPGENPKAIRRSIGQTRRLDVDHYVEKYQDKQLMLINDLNGDVQRWIDFGAEPVPVENRSNRHFEGITDRTESKWVRFVGGDDGMGGHFWVYLLMISPERYDEVKLAPERERQALIRRAVRAGRDRSDYAEGPHLGTYAPNLPTGGRGYSENRSTVGGDAE